MLYHEVHISLLEAPELPPQLTAEDSRGTFEEDTLRVTVYGTPKKVELCVVPPYEADSDPIYETVELRWPTAALAL